MMIRVRSCSNDGVHAESSFIGLLGMYIHTYHSGLHDLFLGDETRGEGYKLLRILLRPVLYNDML